MAEKNVPQNLLLFILIMPSWVVIDESDKMLYTYLDERRSVKYWKMVAFNKINCMVLNVYIIYKDRVEGKAISGLDFIWNTIFKIECLWMNEKQVHSNIMAKAFGLVKLPQSNLRQCVLCSTKNAIKGSHLICVQCKKGIHPTCFDKHRCYKL